MQGKSRFGPNIWKLKLNNLQGEKLARSDGFGVMTLTTFTVKWALRRI